MSINLIQSIKKNLGYAELKKIDPNTQIPVDDGREEDRLNQSAIPAVLIVLYKYTRTDGGAQEILSSTISNDWMEKMLEEDTVDAVAKVAKYAEVPDVIASERMELVAKQAVGLIQAANPSSAQAVKDIISAERNTILSYLPPTLHMGDLLNDTTIDDNVTKMEGPVSGMMKAISGVFSSSEKGKDD